MTGRQKRRGEAHREPHRLQCLRKTQAREPPWKGGPPQCEREARNLKHGLLLIDGADDISVQTACEEPGRWCAKAEQGWRSLPGNSSPEWAEPRGPVSLETVSLTPLPRDRGAGSNPSLLSLARQW